MYFIHNMVYLYCLWITFEFPQVFIKIISLDS